MRQSSGQQGSTVYCGKASVRTDGTESETRPVTQTGEESDVVRGRGRTWAARRAAQQRAQCAFCIQDGASKGKGSSSSPPPPLPAPPPPHPPPLPGPPPPPGQMFAECELGEIPPKVPPLTAIRLGSPLAPGREASPRAPALEEGGKGLLLSVIRPGSPFGAGERGLSWGAFLGGRAETTWKVIRSGQDFAV